MLPYIFFILLTTVLSFFFDRQEEYKGRKKAWYIIVGVYLVLLAGLRNGVGGDTQYYMEAFEHVPTNSSEYLPYISQSMLSSGYMPGWTILNIICKHLFNSFYAVQLIQALIVNICVLYFFRQYTTHIFLCVLMYCFSNVYFSFNMEVLREGIAIALSSVGMHMYIQDKKKWFFILAGCGVLFHISALIVFLFPFTNLKKISLNTLICVFLMALGIFAISDTLFNRLGLFNSDSLHMQHISKYASITLNYFGFLENAFHYMVISAGLIYFVQWATNDDEPWQKSYNRYMSFFLLISIIICSFIGFIRFRNYTMIFFVIMLTEFLYHIKSHIKYMPFAKIIILGSLLFFMCQRYMYYYPQNDRRYYEFFVPYTSVFDSEADTEYRKWMHEEAISHETYSRDTE